MTSAKVVGERSVDVVEVAVVGEHRLIGLELDVRLGAAHVQALENLLELRCCQPAAAAAVGHKTGGLVGPLVVEEVQGVLEYRRVAPVVLREHEHESVVGADKLTPPDRVLVLVAPLCGHDRLVEKGQVDLLEVDELDLDCSSAACSARWTHAAISGQIR